MRYLTEAIPGAAALEQEFGDQEDYVVLAIDPGIKSSATAVVSDSLTPEKAWNLSLPKGCHTWNSLRYTRLLDRLKDQGTVSVRYLEAKILTLECTDPREIGTAQQFQELKVPFRHAKSVLKVENELREFYGSRVLKIAHNRKEQGEKAEVDRVQGMLRATHARVTIDEEILLSEDHFLLVHDAR